MAKKKNAAAQRDGWKFSSNHQNLLFMLANGLVTGPEGVVYAGESKYYNDASSLCPGWIPLFRDTVPADILALSIKETRHLAPVVAHIALEEYRGQAYAFTGGRWELTPYAEIAAECRLIAVPAPLPVAWISSIAFENEEGMSAFRRTAGDVENATVPELRLLPPEKDAAGPLALMGQHHSGVEPFNTFPATEKRNVPMQLTEKTQALGGILAMLYHLADDSELGVALFKKARAAVVLSPLYDAAPPLKTDDAVMKALPRWLAGEAMTDAEWRISFFFGLLDCIIENRERHGLNGLTAAAREYVLLRLGSADGRQHWPKGLKLLEAEENATLRLSELFEKFQGTVSHALLLFFWGERCEDLLEFQDKNPQVVLSDADRLAAALLFGAREGWSGLAKKYRRGLSRWVTSFMAAKAHAPDTAYSPDDAVIVFNAQGLKPLRELFTDDHGAINEKRALDAARKQKWTECLFTRVKIPATYRVDAGFLILPGDTAAKIIVESDLFLARLRGTSPEDKEAIRKGLGDAE